MADNFERFKIKGYEHFGVYLHENQGYLGRCVIWAQRENVLDLADATKQEIEEFFEILLKLKQALIKTFQPDWFNYAFLGNETRHLHCHFVPRYSSVREFEGIIFKDELWGHNYKTDHSFKIPGQVAITIKEKLKKELG